MTDAPAGRLRVKVHGEGASLQRITSWQQALMTRGEEVDAVGVVLDSGELVVERVVER